MRPFSALEVPLSGHVLVEASAGTGKTYAITTVLVRLLIETDLRIDQILVVTFTEAATAELRERVRLRLHQAHRAFCQGGDPDDPQLDALVRASPDRSRARAALQAAIRDADTAAISTIHGFCHRVLRESTFDADAPFDLELITDLRPLRDTVVADHWVRELVDAPPSRVRWLDAHRITPARGGKLLDKALGGPHVRIVPDLDAGDGAAGQGAADELESRYRDCLQRAREVWDAEAVLTALVDAHLNGNKYRIKGLPKKVEAMADYLRQPPAAAQLPDDCFKFTREAIDAAITAKSTRPDHPFFDACQDLHEAAQALAGVARLFVTRFQRGLVDHAREELPRRKEALGVASFDDLLVKVRDALHGPAGGTLASSLYRRHPAALIDEFQDTDPLQFEIFNAIYADPEARLFLVGDPKQAIYSFRGADVFAYMEAADQVGDAGFTMTVNWRSDPSLIAAVNHLFTRPPRPFLLDGIDYHPVEPRPGARDALVTRPPISSAPLEILHVDLVDGESKTIDSSWAQWGIPALVADDIVALLGGGSTLDGAPLGAGNVAVLTRTNKEAFAVQEALRQRRVPSVVLGDHSVFEQPEAEQLQYVLAAVADPTSRTALRAALTTDLLGLTANDLTALEEDEEAWDGWVRDFRDWNALWSAKGFVQMVRALIAERGVQERLLGLVDGERRMTNLLHLVELLHTAATNEHLGPAGVLHWLARQRDVEGYAAEAAQIRLESDERAVRITTVHRSKGLEYDVVYCPYLWKGWLLHPDDEGMLSFHDPDDGNAAKIDIDVDPTARKASRARAEWEQFAENIRLLYVALTRARHRCVLLWGPFYNRETAALGALLHPWSKVPDDISKVRYRRIDASQLEDDLIALESEARGLIGVRTVDRSAVRREGTPLETASAAPRALTCRLPGRTIERGWRVASFSQLVASNEHAPDPAEGRDRADDATEDEVATAEPLALAGFPRGARAGNFFHDVLEHADFTDTERLRGVVADRLRGHGYAESWAETVHAGLCDVLATPLSAEQPGLVLGSLEGERRLNELEFYLPVGPSVTRRRDRFSPAVLAAAFAEHASEAVPADYAERLRRLRFLPLWGHLKGYIDLVFEHDGRWFVVDYKSTWLGEDRDAYARPRLREAMAHGHYYLQYHLYTVAVHRYLQQRLPGYDYDEHFGGALYLFLRGMHPATGPDAGVFFERPPLARIEALSQRLQDPRSGGAR